MTWPTSWSPRPWEEGLDSFAVTGFVDSYRKAPNRHENPVPTEVLHDLALTDDQAAAALNRAATVDGVRAALGRIQASGDATMFIVITYMLDHIQRTGEQPSSRQAGAACGSATPPLQTRWFACVPTSTLSARLLETAEGPPANPGSQRGIGSVEPSALLIKPSLWARVGACTQHPLDRSRA
jgi:hypothetical protein